MSILLLSKEEQGIVIFHVWKSLKYPSRLRISLMCILAGFLLQYLSFNTANNETGIYVGIILVLFGNLLTLVKGYSNKIKLSSFSAEQEWVKTDREQLNNIIEVNKKAKQWDISGLDVSNAFGGIIFILLIVAMIAFTANNRFFSQLATTAIILNFIVLFIPHWITGIRRITLTPKLINKINLFTNLINVYSERLKNDTVEYLIKVRGEEEKLPRDLKIKVKLKNQPDDFLGMYGQVSMNEVNDQEYPYFYVVLVAKRNSGLLKKYYNNIQPPPKVIKEFKEEGDVEIIVIRQYTTKTSGYCTKSRAISTIFNTGLLSAKEIISRN